MLIPEMDRQEAFAVAGEPRPVAARLTLISAPASAVVDRTGIATGMGVVSLSWVARSGPRRVKSNHRQAFAESFAINPPLIRVTHVKSKRF